MAELIFRSGRELKRHPLKGRSLIVGRGGGAELDVNDALVSREHCVIERLDGGYLLRDLDSRNGTYVNGLRITEKFLEFGDRIRVGDTVLLFVAEGEAPERGPAAAVPAAPAALPTQTHILESRQIDLESAFGRQPAADSLRLVYELATANADTPERLVEICLDALMVHLRVGRAAVIVENRRLDRRRVPGSPVPEIAPPDLQRVLKKGRSMFTERARDPSGRLYSFILVPLRGKAETYGALYLDDLDADRPLQPADLHTASALGHLAGIMLESLRHASQLRKERETLRSMMLAQHPIVAESPKMKAVLELADRAAMMDHPVLLTGESGTGKEIIARRIHLNSPRSGRPFVALNCGAVPRELFESELFGHEKGAFTGAAARKPGLFEAAHSGTLFFDEIADLPMELQAKLLRVLEHRVLRRVGGVEDLPIDVRIVASTNRRLREEVKAGRFREDLYYRLDVISIVVPPLRERAEDIPALAQAFAHPKKLSEASLARLSKYPWPGNVRELRNVVERACLLSSKDVVEVTLPADAALPPAALRPLHEVEREHIAAVLKAVGGNKSRAAEVLGIDRVTLYNKIEKYRL